MCGPAFASTVVSFTGDVKYVSLFSSLTNLISLILCVSYNRKKRNEKQQTSSESESPTSSGQLLTSYLTVLSDYSTVRRTLSIKFFLTLASSIFYSGRLTLT